MNQPRTKMYVIVRGDIPKNWYIPQACHAVAEYAKEYTEEFMHWGNRSIVILLAENKLEFNECVNILFGEEVLHAWFNEPYKNTGPTALAFTSYDPISAFKTLKLLA